MLPEFFLGSGNYFSLFIENYSAATGSPLIEG
jgi:hypothetical protein